MPYEILTTKTPQTPDIDNVHNLKINKRIWEWLSKTAATNDAG